MGVTLLEKQLLLQTPFLDVLLNKKMRLLQKQLADYMGK